MPHSVITLGKSLKPAECSFLLDREVAADPATAEMQQQWRALLHGKHLLITGAGGSIGSELAVRAALVGARLTLLDRDETTLTHTALRVQAAGGSTPQMMLVDICDAATVQRAVGAAAPELLIHAAALKHVGLLQRSAAQAWRINVLGTRNVLVAARMAGVRQLVNISTDKAADPVSVLGLTKALGERLVAWVSQPQAAGVASQPQRYVSVRFGNVLGSRGSLVPLVRERLRLGLPVQLREPAATRYFMTPAEACEFVFTAFAMTARSAVEPGAVLVRQLGEPVVIGELVRRLLHMEGATSQTAAQTGLLPGEKMHERLVGEHESAQATAEAGIVAVRVDPLPLKKLARARQAVLKLRDS